MAVDLLPVSKGTGTSPPPAGRGEGHRAVLGHFMGLTRRPVLSNLGEKPVAEGPAHLGSVSWRLAGPSLKSQGQECFQVL